MPLAKFPEAKAGKSWQISIEADPLLCFFCNLHSPCPNHVPFLKIYRYNYANTDTITQIQIKIRISVEADPLLCFSPLNAFCATVNYLFSSVRFVLPLLHCALPFLQCALHFLHCVLLFLQGPFCTSFTPLTVHYLFSTLFYQPPFLNRQPFQNIQRFSVKKFFVSFKNHFKCCIKNKH